MTVEKLGPCQAKISFTVPSAEFEGALQRALVHAGRNVRMKGFRPGHVPVKVLERQFGKEIQDDTVQGFLRQAFEQAVNENKLKVVGLERMDLKDVKRLAGADFSHHFNVSLRPEIELGEYKGLEIESELEQVMDQEVEAALVNLRAEQSTPEPVGDTGLAADGMALVKVEWLVDGEVVLSRDGLRLSPTSPTPGTDPEEFKAAMLGAKDGDTRDVAMTIPADFDKQEFAGRPAVCRLSITQAFRMVPPSDADIRGLLGAKDDAELREIVRTKIDEAKHDRENLRIEAALIDRLLASHEFELPAAMVEEQTRGRLAQLARDLEQQGTPKERIEEQVETQKQAAHDAAVRGIRALFLIQTLGETEKLLVTREDLQQEMAAIAQRNRATVEEVAEYYKKNSLFEQMAMELLERKVRKFLRENAKITHPS